MNSFGNSFKVSVCGSSHGEAVGVVIEGVPAGIELSVADFEEDLAQRRAGAVGTTARHETDVPNILSGICDGFTTGEPIEITFQNTDTRAEDYEQFRAHPRPSHADRVATVRWGERADLRGGGQASGRMTVCIVAAGVIAKKVLGAGISFETRLIKVGGCCEPSRFEQVIAEALQEGDSVGGVVECVVRGVPIGLGEPFFNSVESVVAHLLFSIPAVKGVEFGAGFEVANRRGSENNDPIIAADGTTATNNDGGINGGLANGNPIVVRAAVKPTPSIARPQQSWNFEAGKVEPLVITGRHDACIALRAAVAVEDAIAIALAELGIMIYH